MDPTLCPGVEVCPFLQIHPNDRSQKDLGSHRAHQKSGEMKECTSRCGSNLKLNIRQLLLEVPISTTWILAPASPSPSFSDLLLLNKEQIPPGFHAERTALLSHNPQPQLRPEEELATRGCEMPSAASNFHPDSRCLRLQPKACPMSLLMPHPPAH